MTVLFWCVTNQLKSDKVQSMVVLRGCFKSGLEERQGNLVYTEVNMRKFAKQMFKNEKKKTIKDLQSSNNNQLKLPNY